MGSAFFQDHGGLPAVDLLDTDKILPGIQYFWILPCFLITGIPDKDLFKVLLFHSDGSSKNRIVEHHNRSCRLKDANKLPADEHRPVLGVLPIAIRSVNDGTSV